MDILHDLVGYELLDLTITENVYGADELWIEREDGTDYCLRASLLSFVGDPSTLVDSEIRRVEIYANGFFVIESMHGAVTFSVQGHKSVEVY